MLVTRGAHKKKLHCGRNCVSGELDNKVLEYVEMARKKGREPLNNQQVQQVARDFGKEMGVAGFKASWSWLKRWKGRCDALKESTSTAEENAGLDDRHAVHNSLHKEVTLSSRTILSSYQLTFLSVSDKKGVVCLDECMDEDSERVPSTDAVCTFDYSTPEHNYSMISPSKASSSQLAYRDRQTTPNLQSNVVELLENVALLHAHEHSGLELTLGERLEGSFLHGASPEEKISTANSDDASSSELSQDTFCQSVFLDYAGLDGTQEFTCPVPSSTSILEEEQLMSVFNHRSFTDPFPFLPTSFICCPSEQAHSLSTDDIGIDELMETQLFDNTNKRSRKKAKTKQKRVFMSCSDSIGFHNSSYLAGGKQTLRSYSVSPSSNSEHKNSPPHGGLLGSPSYPCGLLASSPPGGLLASRRSQPVFPDEPEIVFHEIQLGSLHTTPTM